MGNLKFICCGWEIEILSAMKIEGSYIDKANYKHSIRMYSEETLEKN